MGGSHVRRVIRLQFRSLPEDIITTAMLIVTEISYLEELEEKQEILGVWDGDPIVR
jgi:hypothetical protein